MPASLTDQNESPQRLESLERSIRFYRSACMLLAAGIAILGFLRIPTSSPERAPAQPEMQEDSNAFPGREQGLGEVGSIDVGERYEELSRTRSHLTDVSETYFHSDAGSVHLHSMGAGQRVPLHIHRMAHEITIIVRGAAKTAHVFGRDGRFATSEGERAPGSLIYSPPMSGHEWFNLSNTSMLGNLVFGLPVFRGNLYVERDDPQLLEGGEPFFFDAVEELAAFLRGEEETSVQTLPFLEGRMTVLFVRSRYVLPRFPGRPSLAYIAAGEGVIKSSVSEPIHEHQLVSLARRTRVVFKADRPLAIYLFDILGSSEGEQPRPTE